MIFKITLTLNIIVGTTRDEFVDDLIASEFNAILFFTQSTLFPLS